MAPQVKHSACGAILIFKEPAQCLLHHDLCPQGFLLASSRTIEMIQSILKIFWSFVLLGAVGFLFICLLASLLETEPGLELTMPLPKLVKWQNCIQAYVTMPSASVAICVASFKKALFQSPALCSSVVSTSVCFSSLRQSGLASNSPVAEDDLTPHLPAPPPKCQGADMHYHAQPLTCFLIRFFLCGSLYIGYHSLHSLPIFLQSFLV